MPLNIMQKYIYKARIHIQEYLDHRYNIPLIAAYFWE